MRGQLFSGSREDWLAMRDTRLGASEAAIPLGLNPYESLKSLVKRKRSGARKPDSAAMAQGRDWEPRIIVACDALLGKTSRHSECRYTDDLIVTFDALLDGDVPLEIKTTAVSNHARWLAHGPPPWYEMQVRAQLWMAEAPVGVLACAFMDKGAVRDLRVVEIGRDDKLVERSIAEWRRAWENCAE